MIKLRFIILVKLILTGLLFCVEEFSFPIEVENTPHIIENYYEYPIANSQIIIDSSIIDVFSYKFAVTSENLIHANIENQVWDIIPNSDLILPNITSSIIVQPPFSYRGCPTISVDLIPWRIDKGRLEYLKSGTLRILIDDDPTFPEIFSIHPEIINKKSLSTLSRDKNETEYIIITSETLLEVADSIKVLHETLVPTENQLNVEIVLNTDVFSEYPEEIESYAIREFIQDRMYSTQSIDYFLLLGDETSLPPIYLGNTPSDDFYTSPSISSNSNPILSTGRIPVSNLNDALTFVEKLKRYTLRFYEEEQLPGVPDNWRSRILLFSDDENKSGTSISSEISHTAYSDSLYKRIHNILNVSTVYGTDYVPIPDGGWLAHPNMTEDILATINSGVALINYVGHGSPHTLSDERIINLNRDLSSINDPVNTIWVVGTCSFGKYDGEDSMPEALIAKSDGAIGVITTSRSIGFGANFKSLRSIADSIVCHVQNQLTYRFGDLIKATKRGEGSYIFHLFGDPAMQLPFPKISEIIDTTTSSSFTILNPATVDLLSNSGYLSVYGPDKSIVREYSDTTLRYSNPGDIIFQGGVTNSTDFIIPMDLSFCDTCTAQIIVYAEDFYNTSSFQIDNLIDIPIYPTQSDQTDFEGPIITIYQDNQTVQNGGVISKPFSITLNYEDNSGINLMGAMGHNLCYWIDYFDENQATILNNQFVYETPTRGSVLLLLPDTLSGKHQIHLKAWDNVNNITEEEYTLYFTDNFDFHADYILNFPNPFGDRTDFTFHLSENGEVTINIYSLSGRKVKTITRGSLSSGYNEIQWDGKDEFGKLIANGTYLYHFKAKSEAGSKFESIEKLSKTK